MIMRAWWWPYKVAYRLLHHCHEVTVMGCLLIRGCLLILVLGSLLGSPNGRWRCRRCWKWFWQFFSCVAQATVVPVIRGIRGFFRLTVCWWWESTEHRISFGLLECLLTLLVERSKEGVSFMFPFLQSRQIFRLSLARLPKLASICNLVVISATALESPVYLVRPGFVIWNIKYRVSVRNKNNSQNQRTTKYMIQIWCRNYYALL